MPKTDYTSIFIVEDDPSYASAIRHSLEAKNYANVKIFTTGEECLANIDLKPEIVLLDFWLGDNHKNGLEVLKAIKSHNPDIQVVFLTANDKLETATSTIKSGAYDYVVKTETALERIKNILRRIIFENHIKKENRLLKRSRKVIISVIVILALTIVILGLIQMMSF
jgi:two-component system, OmpR family, response regulator